MNLEQIARNLKISLDSPYISIYAKKEVLFSELTTLPISTYEPPYFPETLKAFMTAVQKTPSQISRATRGKLSESEITHFCNRSGPYNSKHLNKEEHGESRFRLPITYGKLLEIGKPTFYVRARIPILFYDKQTGKLFLPFSDRLSPSEIVDSFIVPYMSNERKLSRSVVKSLLQSRYRQIKCGEEESGELSRERRAHFRELKLKIDSLSYHTKGSRLYQRLFIEDRLSLEPLFLLPPIVIPDREQIISEVENHLKSSNSFPVLSPQYVGV